MPRKKNETPSYLPQASGQARVRINGHDIYLGKYGSPESKERYARIIAENFGPSAPPLLVPVRGEGPITIARLARLYDDHARLFYVKDGECTDDRYRAIIDPLVRLQLPPRMLLLIVSVRLRQ